MSFHEEEVLGKAYDARLMRRLLQYLRPYKLPVALALAAIISASVLQLAQPYLMKLAIDRYIANGDLRGIDRIAAAFLGILAASFILEFAQTYTLQMTGQRIMFDMRLEIYRHLQRIDLQFYDRNPVGRLMTRVTTDVDVLNDMFTSGVVSIFGDIFTLAGIMIVLVMMDWRLAIVAFAVLPLIVIVTQWFRRNVRESYRNVRRWVARINAFLQEHITGMGTVQLFRRERRSFERFDEINRKHRDANIDSIQFYAIFYPAIEVIGALASAMIIWFGGGWTLQGTLTIGSLVAFLLYSGRFFRPISDMSEKFNVLQAAMASSERIFKLLDTPVKIASGSGIRGAGSDGTRDAGSGIRGAGSDGTRDAGSGIRGAGSDGTRDAGSGIRGAGSDGTRDAGSGIRGAGSDGTRDAGPGIRGAGSDGTRDAGPGIRGAGSDGTRDAGPGIRGAGSDGTRAGGFPNRADGIDVLRTPDPGSRIPEGHILFDHVSFAYDGENEVLRDVSFEVRPGERVGIVGATGAGKSTLINLLLRFYDVTQGRILVDGVDVRDMDLTRLRRLFSLVLQDVHLFSGTIAANIRLGEASIPDEAVRRAAEAVHANRFIERLPAGYASAVAERGATLSVGQKQLLSFARALAFDPRILVLDEATSSVDTETELLIRDALTVLMAGRTTIAIAHRLSTIQDMDMILVLHKGQLRESGRHQDLLAQRGIYYKLYQLQYRDQEGGGTRGEEPAETLSAE